MTALERMMEANAARAHVRDQITKAARRVCLSADADALAELRALLHADARAGAALGDALTAFKDESDGGGVVLPSPAPQASRVKFSDSPRGVAA